jgi:hypothetical protein
MVSPNSYFTSNLAILNKLEHIYSGFFITGARQYGLGVANFMPSCIAVHPKTDEVYVVSSIDHSLAVYEKSGKLINFVRLNKTLFIKPERILFLQNGDLVITNEGQQGKTSLLRFKWHLPQ